MSFKELSQQDWFIPMSEGNAKLKNSKAVRFLQFNLPAITTCPFATGDCIRNCYAKGSERYPNVKNARQRNYNASMGDDFVARMVATINAYMEKPSYKNAKKVVVRIHESGDFYSKEYAIKWLKIAYIINALHGGKVVFMAYTKSVKYFVGADIPANMTVRYSLWCDTNADDYELAQELGLPVYTAVESFDGFKGARCRCADCGTCGMCWNKKVEIIACEIH